MTLIVYKVKVISAIYDKLLYRIDSNPLDVQKYTIKENEKKIEVNFCFFTAASLLWFLRQQRL